MKIKLLFFMSIITMGLLAGCSTGGCGQSGCGYTDYNSVCGYPSCTDNRYIEQYSNPCPGPYNCNNDGAG